LISETISNLKWFMHLIFNHGLSDLQLVFISPCIYKLYLKAVFSSIQQYMLYICNEWYLWHLFQFINVQLMLSLLTVFCNYECIMNVFSVDRFIVITIVHFGFRLLYRLMQSALVLKICSIVLFYFLLSIRKLLLVFQVRDGLHGILVFSCVSDVLAYTGIWECISLK